MNIKEYKLDEEEQEILEAFESGKLESVPNVEAEKQQLVRAVKRQVNNVVDKSSGMQ